MSEASIVALVRALLGSGGLTAWHTLRKDKREAPVKQKDADIAAAHTSQQMALAVAESLRVDLEEKNRNLNKVQGEAEETRAVVADARREAANARRQADAASTEAAAARRENGILRTWIHLLIDNWPTVRQSETPPAEPTIH